MKKRILVVTTGTRDVQIKVKPGEPDGKDRFTYDVPGKDRRSISVSSHNDHPGTLLLTSVRSGCLKLAEDYPVIKDYLLFPLIEAAVKYVLNEAGKIDLLLFIVTNQVNENVPVRFKEKDTVNLPPLAEQHLNDLFPGDIGSFDTYEVFKRITDIDFWYDNFETEFREGRLIDDPGQETELWFMPQGGLDQVNQALTLRFIEHYHDLKLLQIAEDCEPRELDFPVKFLHNLTRAKAKEMAKKFLFNEVEALNISNDKTIKLLADTGSVIMRLDFNSLARSRNDLTRFRNVPDIINQIHKTWTENLNSHTINKILYLTCKVHYFCENPDEMLWRLYTLRELMLKPYVAEWIGWRDTSEEYPFRDLNRNIEKNWELVRYLREHNINDKVLKPGVHLFNVITEYNRDHSRNLPREVRKTWQMIGRLQNWRNTLIHQGKGLNMNEITGVIAEEDDLSIDELFSDYLDHMYNVCDYDLLGELRKELISLL